jgi:putative tricarboxylic transport membrane protein
VSLPHQLTAAVCGVFAAFVIRESVGLELYTPMGPGPGFFPLGLAIVFGGLAVAMFGQATVGRPPSAGAFWPRRAGCLRMAAILGVLVGTTLLLEPLGFRLTSLAAYLFLLNVPTRQNVIVSVLVALAGSFGVYHVFAHFLKVPLPVGVLGL